MCASRCPSVDAQQTAQGRPPLWNRKRRAKPAMGGKPLQQLFDRARSGLFQQAGIARLPRKQTSA
jgi:hypothetical protein